jgi:hypothetical protein
MRFDLATIAGSNLADSVSRIVFASAGKLRMQIDGNSDHAQVVVQEILARGLVRLVTGQPDRDCPACPHSIDLGQGIASHVA